MPAWIQEQAEISAWVLLPIALGVALRRGGVPKVTARRLFGFAFYGCQTTVMVCAIWIAETRAEARLLPLLALSGWLLTAALAWPLSARLSAHSGRRGAFILSMAMSNNGFTLLGFIALSVFGEAGLAQATYAQLLYTPFFLLCCFPIARVFGGRKEDRRVRELLRDNALDPRVWVPLVSIAFGLGLNAARIPRPKIMGGLSHVLIFLGTAVSSCAIGLLFSGFHLRRYWRENLLSLVHRSSLYPLFYFGVARLAHLRALDAKILVLYGLVPSALLANMLAVFFDLDTDLTSSMFLTSTLLFLVFVLPMFLAVAH